MKFYYARPVSLRELALEGDGNIPFYVIFASHDEFVAWCDRLGVEPDDYYVRRVRGGAYRLGQEDYEWAQWRSAQAQARPIMAEWREAPRRAAMRPRFNRRGRPII